MLEEQYTLVKPIRNPLDGCLRVGALAAQLRSDRTTGTVIQCCPQFELKAVLQCQEGRTLSISRQPYTAGQSSDINCVCTQDPSYPPFSTGSKDDGDGPF